LGEGLAAEDEDVFVEAFVGVDATVCAAAPEDGFIEHGGFEVHGVFPAVGLADIDKCSGIKTGNLAKKMN